MKTKHNPRFILLVALVITAAFSRLIPHPPNFTPLFAMALFSGAYFSTRLLRYAVPLSAMALSDAALSFMMGYDFFNLMRLIIYSCVAGMALLGEWNLSNRVSAARVLVSSCISCIAFYLVTNFAVWAGGKLYPLNWEGLMTSYFAALPYLKNSLAGALLYSAALFGAYEWSKKNFPAFREQAK
jgi:hypothetical protein